MYYARRMMTLAAIVIGTTNTAYAGAPALCPAGFYDLGVQSAGTSTSPHEAKVPFRSTTWTIPSHVVIDTSQRVQSGPLNGGAAGPVAKYDQFPPGVLVIATGMESDCTGWSFTTPVFLSSTAIESKLYCHSGSPRSCFRGINNCTVQARICLKKK